MNAEVNCPEISRYWYHWNLGGTRLSNMLYYWICQTDRSIFTTCNYFNTSMWLDFCHVFIINRFFTQFNCIITLG